MNSISILLFTQWTTGITATRIDAFDATGTDLVVGYSASLGRIATITVAQGDWINLCLQLDIGCGIRFGPSPAGDDHFAAQEDGILLVWQYGQADGRNEVSEGNWSPQTQQRNIVELITCISRILRMWRYFRYIHIDIGIIANSSAATLDLAIWIRGGIPFTQSYTRQSPIAGNGSHTMCRRQDITIVDQRTTAMVSNLITR